MPKRKTRDPERTKSRLLEAALSLFARSGFAGTSVESIAKRAGVNISMISHHFGGKEGLYRACLRDFAQARAGLLAKHLEAPSTREELRLRVELMVEELVTFHLAHAAATSILLHDLSGRALWGEELDEALFGFIALLADFLAKAKRRKLLRAEVDPFALASLIYLSFKGLIQAAPETERALGVSLAEPGFRSRTIRTALDLVWNGALRERDV